MKGIGKLRFKDAAKSVIPQNTVPNERLTALDKEKITATARRLVNVEKKHSAANR